jgi:hypothetical protein
MAASPRRFDAEERMLKRNAIIAGVLAIGFVLGLGTQAFTQDKKPAEKKPPTTRSGLYRIHAAARSLEDAERHLKGAELAYDGHRARALELVKQAQGELKQAVEYAKANPPAPAKPSTSTPAPATGATPGTKQ